MGGASEDDNAMKWFLQRANGEDIIILRTSGSDGYNAYIDTLFLNEANWQEAFKNIPDPDWHPKPNSLAAYWEQIYNFADVVKYYEKTDVE
jgi:hypothetical protein